MKNLRMKSARAALDMSQQELADIVGVTRQTINAIERGDYNPTIKLCLSICRGAGQDARRAVLGRLTSLRCTVETTPCGAL